MTSTPDHPARHWAEVWHRAWEARDTDAIVVLSGLVTEQRDTWNQADGRISPPEGWGR